MHGWKQGDMFLAGQENRDYFDLISYVGIRGILFVSGPWYCQIQTTRLIMFFLKFLSSWADNGNEIDCF